MRANGRVQKKRVVLKPLHWIKDFVSGWLFGSRWLTVLSLGAFCHSLLVRFDTLEKRAPSKVEMPVKG